MVRPEDVLAYWLDELEPKHWYVADPAIDKAITERFETAWDRAMEGSLSLWLTYPSGTLAYIILTDQFSRNMFRDTGRAFSSDMAALTAAKMAVSKGWDMRIDPPARQFFYMPLMHSETLADQDRAVRLIASRLPEGGANTLLHAQAHREVIRRYGRFPTRNEALGRENCRGEAAYLAEGGYGAVVRSLKESVA
ncbi:MAG: DUF924 family protein [Pseudomonadota bacterium]